MSALISAVTGPPGHLDDAGAGLPGRTRTSARMTGYNAFFSARSSMPMPGKLTESEDNLRTAAGHAEDVADTVDDQLVYDYFAAARSISSLSCELFPAWASNAR